MNSRRLWRGIFAVVIAMTAGARSASAGDCLSGAEGIQLRSDTVHWAFAIRPNLECIQGLRGNTMLIHEVKIVESPRAGSLTISGPAFHYHAPSTATEDSFKIEVSGENRRMPGTSVIVVGVSIK